MITSYVQPEKGYFTKLFQFLFVLFVVLPVGLVLQRVENVKKAELKRCIDNEKMQVIVLREEDDAVNSRVVAACEGLWDANNPAIQFYKNSEQSLEWFRVDQNRYQGETPPAFILRLAQKGEAPHYGVVYAAIAGNDSMSQLREWLKVNKYSDSDYELSSNGYNNTTQFYPILNDSKIRVDGYVETTGFLWLLNYEWLWDGGFLRNVTGQGIHENYGKIQDLVLPVRHNLLRTFGITYMWSLFWKLIYLVIKLIYYALLITSVCSLFVGKEIVGVRPSRIVLSFRMFGFFLISMYFIFFFLPLPRNLSTLDIAARVSAAMYVISMGIGFVFTLTMNSLLEYNYEFQKFKELGGRPFWDFIPWPVNRTSDIEQVTGIAEPQYTTFVPPSIWEYQCPVCGSKVEKAVDICWNCNYGAEPPARANQSVSPSDCRQIK